MWRPVGSHVTGAKMQAFTGGFHMKFSSLIPLAAAGLLLTAGAAAAKPFVGQELLPQAKVGLQQARAAALKAHPGQITDEELENEKGGSGLRYSFDIRSKGATFEVGVDARTGRVLENAKEGPHPD
jgi:hypothetical protein